MSDQLVEVARFGSANEAAIARSVLDAAGISAVLDQEATATWLWHYGTALGGVKLRVRSSDADEARAILGGLSDEAVDFEADSTLAPGEDREEAEDEDASTMTPVAVRAWRAAVIGMVVLPPLLNIYSLWLLIRHGLLLPGENEPVGWRAAAALAINLAVLGTVGLLLWAVS